MLAGAEARETAPPELLAEVFELNEALEESEDPERLETIRARFRGLLAETDGRLAALYRAYEAGRLAELRALVSRRKYLSKLVERIPA
jgi:hypothetical protein